MSVEWEISNHARRVRISFNPPGTADRITVFERTEAKDFYPSFYESVTNGIDPLKTTREIQFATIFGKVSSLAGGQLDGKRCVDVGAGPGHFVDYLRKNHGVDIVGYEPSLPAEREHLKRGALADIEQTYDIVFLLDVLEHLEHPKDALKKIHKITSSDGYVCIKVPNKGSLLYRVAKIFRAIRWFGSKLLCRMYQLDFPPPHFFYYDQKSLLEIMETKFTPIAVFYVSELPRQAAWDRLWGMSLFVKCLMMPVAIIYDVLTFGALNDGLVFVGRKK
jgi:SAM-dependent methyltransferase